MVSVIIIILFLTHSLVFVLDFLLSLHSFLSLILGSLHLTPICAVFFDLHKAFDSVPHCPLLDTLSSFNILPTLLRWLHSYLCDRLQLVVVNGSSSLTTKVLSGVPQGSILGPLLFIIYINNVAKIPLHSHARLTMYADDILLSQPFKSASDFSSIQSNINSISSWISSHFLTINSSKTKYMIVSLKSQSSFSSFPSLCLNGSPLERVPSFKYLGVHISCNLSWQLHVKTICGKARKLIGILFRHFYRHSSLSVLFKLYISIIRPHLEYCSSVWDSSSSTLSSSLEKVQFFALKLCSKQWSSHYSSLLHCFSCPSLSSRRKNSKLVFLFKALSGLAFFPSDIFNFQPPPYMAFRSYHPYNLIIPFAHTSAFRSSFVPSTCSLWNSLPPHLKDSPSLASFKFNLCKLYY